MKKAFDIKSIKKEIDLLKNKRTELSKELGEIKMLFEARFSQGIRKDGWVHGDAGKAYIIANDFEDATRKAIDAFMKWKYLEKKGRERYVLESVTLIDDEPVF